MRTAVAETCRFPALPQLGWLKAQHSACVRPEIGSSRSRGTEHVFSFNGMAESGGIVPDAKVARDNSHESRRIAQGIRGCQMNGV